MKSKREAVSFLDSVLVVSSGEKGKERFDELLAICGFLNIAFANSGAEARRKLGEYEVDLVIINCPLRDEFGHELALKFTQETASGVIMLVKSELADEISAKVEDFGVFVLEKPLSRQLFFQTLKLVGAACRRMAGLRQENVKLQSKIEEIRLVDRAKCALIQYLSMTEEQAHRFIEKQAMDMRTTKREIAQGILKSYEY